MLDEVEKLSGATADVEQPQLAVIASGENFMELRQGLAPHRIGCAVEQDLDLGVIALSGLIRQPAAGLKVEILQIVARPRAAGVFVENLIVGPPFAASIDLGKILKEQPGAINQREQRPVGSAGRG